MTREAGCRTSFFWCPIASLLSIAVAAAKKASTEEARYSWQEKRIGLVTLSSRLERRNLAMLLESTNNY